MYFFWLLASGSFLYIGYYYGGYFSFYFCIGAIFTCITSLLASIFIVQLVSFICFSMILGPVFYKKYLCHIAPKQTYLDFSKLIGQQAIVTHPIKSHNNQHGLIFFDNEYWHAASLSSETISADSIVFIHHIEGLTVFVSTSPT